MTTKDWLMRARRQDRLIETLLESKAHAYDRCTSTTAALKSVCVISAGKSSPDSKVASYVILSESVDSAIDKLADIKRELLAALALVDDCVLRALLNERYVNCKKWDEVAHLLRYSPGHVKKTLHPKALRAVEKILNNSEKSYTILLRSVI